MREATLELIRCVQYDIDEAIKLASSGVTDWLQYEELLDDLPLLQLEVIEDIESRTHSYLAATQGMRLIKLAEIILAINADWALVQEFFIEGLGDATQEDCVAHLLHIKNHLIAY